MKCKQTCQKFVDRDFLRLRPKGIRLKLEILTSLCFQHFPQVHVAKSRMTAQQAGFT
jgi:hypothetical protein